MSSLPPPMPLSYTLPPPPIPQIARAIAVGVVQDSDSSYFNSFPPGYRFRPTEDELIDQYLKKKVLNQQLPKNRINEVDLYKHNPDYLTANYLPCGEKQWYFFTHRDRKYKNGNRPNRVAGNGYWKASIGDQPIYSNGRHVGDRMVLVFYSGKHPNGKKTNWLMYEYRLTRGSNGQTNRGSNDMKLDDWVLCKIYRRPGKSSSREVPHTEDPLEDVDTRMENSDHPTADQFHEDIGPTNAPNNFNLSREVCHAEGLREDVDIRMENSDLPTAPQFNEDTGPTNAPNNFNLSERVFNYNVEMDGHNELVNQLPGEEYPNPSLHNSPPLLPSEPYHMFPDNFPFESNYIGSGYGDPIIPLLELISFEPPQHFTDSEYQLGSSTTGFANDDHLGFMQQNDDISHRFESFSKNNFDGFELPSDDFLQDTTWMSSFLGDKSE